jgi:predicted ATPase/transcriptional regulator with XRE-family HTH domain
MKEKRSRNDKLQRERLSLGWRQEEVAEKLGVDVRTVRRWESGHPVRPLNISGLTQLFGKSAEELGLIEEGADDTSGLTVTQPLEDASISLSTRDSLEHDQVKRSTADYTLPIQPTPLIGREPEIAAVKQLLCREEVRLLTLTGSGGTGKTRLGVQVAHELRNIFADGVFFVSLAPIREPSLVSTAIAQTLGIWEVGGQSLLDSLKTYLRDKQLLLLLDNFEQVLSAAGQIADLLAACSMLKILVTSREMLHIRAEYEFVVPPLPLPERLSSGVRPDLVTLSRNPAIALFVQRAQSIKPDFQVTLSNIVPVTEICIRLDGLPLAIELAAARSKLLTPQALLTWLERRLLVLTGGPKDVPLRQQTLRNTIEWSYDLLNAEEQRLFRRLSIFVGGFILEAVVAFCSLLGDTTVSALNRIDSLIDKSLLQPMKQSDEEEQRFIMLETICEYGQEALAAHGEMEVVRRSHALTYLEVAEQAEPELLGPQQAQWLERLDRESGNLRAAMQWWLEQPDHSGVEKALRLGGALQQFWEVRGYRSEGRKFLQRALTAKAEVAPSVRAKALDAAIVLAVNQSDLDQAVALCEENLALCREHKDARGTALSIHRLSWIAWARGRLVEARSMEEGALALFRKLGDKWGIAASLEGAASVALDQADYARAYTFLEECLALWRELGNEWGLAYSLWLLACVVFYSEGDGMKALPIIEESLSYSRKLRHKSSVSYALITLGFVFFFQGNIDKARSIFEESLALSREIGDWRSIASGLYAFGWIAFSQGDYTTARAHYWESLAILKDLDHQWIIALSIEGLAMVAGAQGQLTEAARLWGASEALREAISAPVPPVNRILYEQLKDALCTQLGEDAFTSALVEGRAMTREEVLTVQKPMS